MGEADGNLFEPDFNRSIKVQTTDHRITSNAGVLLLRDAEHRLGLIESIASKIDGPSRPVTWKHFETAFREQLSDTSKLPVVGVYVTPPSTSIAFRLKCMASNTVRSTTATTVRPSTIPSSPRCRSAETTTAPESSRSGAFLLEHYRRRGTFEDRLGEFNGAIGPYLSSQNFKENEATMLLGLLAFNLNTVCRNELEDSVGGCWDLTRFQLFMLKVGAEIIKHSRRLIVRIAESARPLWSRLTERLERWQQVSDLTPKPSGFTPLPRHAHQSEVLRW